MGEMLAAVIPARNDAHTGKWIAIDSTRCAFHWIRDGGSNMCWAWAGTEDSTTFATTLPSASRSTKMARQFLGCPASSAPVQRIFSEAGLRCQLDDEKPEVLTWAAINKRESAQGVVRLSVGKVR